MGTFSGSKATDAAKADVSNVPKDDATKEQVDAAEGAKTEDGPKVLSPENPNEPAAIVDETDAEATDRHVASREMEAGDVTDPVSQDEGAVAQDAAERIVPGAASGPDVAGVIRNDFGKVAYAPPGTLNAAMNGVQEDASGHVDSVHTDNSSKSGVRI